MSDKMLRKKIETLPVRYRIDNGAKFRLKQVDPQDTGKLKSRTEAEAILKYGVELLSELQAKLYAQDRWALLLIFQAMDAAGKDSAIKHVMSGINPQGCQVFSFKAPTAHELDHDYLWRTHNSVPERGRIGIFNRSYYEEVLVVRVHPEILGRQQLPEQLLNDDIWEHRFEDINAFERYLTRNGVAIRKFFLHVSKDEQKKRFLKRLNEPEKNWKFSSADVQERGCWNEYMSAYEEMIRKTATKHAPWYVVPADHKWFTRAVVAGAIVDALNELEVNYPTVPKEKMAELEEAKKRLMGE